MRLDSYRTLGRSGLRVSPLCLGAMTFGSDWGFGADEASASAMLDLYLGSGGNFIDAANIYTKGHAEAILGGYFAERGGRDRVVLATKFGGNLFSGDPNGGGAGRKAVLQQLENSLRRLKTDYLDLYWLHFEDPHTPMDETLRVLDDLVASGKVRYLGVSDVPAWKVAQAQTEARLRDRSPFIALQIEYSLVERSVEHELMPMARELGLGVTPWSPLRGGLLSGKYRRGQLPDQGRHKPGSSKSLTDRNFSIIESLEAVAAEAGTGMARAAIAWVLAKPGVTSPILGARTVEQLQDNLAALELVLSPEQIRRLDEASLPPPHFPQSFLLNTAAILQGGTEVDGRPSPVWPLAPRNDQERW
jgi:aryl-alcohol dehydrogenase-like predicted oxidoreductase